MELRVLGCSGGVGAGLRTTSFLLDGEILLDAGSGVASLTLEEMTAIRHIFLSHSHLDHILSIPLMVDSVFDRIKEPIQVHAQPETIHALREHVFNGAIWPDFTRLPHPESPVIRLLPMECGESRTFGGRTIESIRVNHIVPTVGFRVTGPDKVFAFSADTTTNDTLWEALNGGERLDTLIVEATFPDTEEALSRMAYHYCPKMLAADLAKLRHDPAIYLTHAKPGEEENIYRACQDLMPGRDLHRLSGGDVFTL